VGDNNKMKKLHPFFQPCLAALLLCSSVPMLAAEKPQGSNPYAKWEHGPGQDPNFFPIAVWLQSPAKAEQYRKAGINTYVGLWKGPSEEQLATLKKAGMKLICRQNSVGLQHLEDPTIIGWMHGDEPDNAQSLPQGKGYGPPITPAKIVEGYEKVRAADPSRPVLLNMGQGVAWDNYIGRGVRRNHPEDYPEYMKGADIVSFDIYPAVHDSKEIAGNLWYVPKGVERLINWSKGEKVVWNCLECTHISNVAKKATPRQLRAEAWMSLIHGSRGLIYFVHQFKPVFREAALLDDPEMLQAATELNNQIASLAPVLNSPTLAAKATADSSNAEVPIATMIKAHGGATYLFAAAMRDGKTNAKFALPGITGTQTIFVIGENRELKAKDGVFTDDFAAWDVHLYKMR
jgi:hypothetical protein